MARESATSRITVSADCQPRRTVVGLYLLAALLVVPPCHAAAAESGKVIAGRVTEISGDPLRNVLVGVATAPKEGLRSLATFTDGDGRFNLSVDAALGAGGEVFARRLGYEETGRSSEDGELRITMARTGNIASQVANGAWLDHVAPEAEADDAKGAILLVCSTCHTFPSDEVSNFIGVVDPADEEARKAVWFGVTKLMDDFFSGSFADHGAEESAFVQGKDKEGAFILNRDKEIISALLARAATQENLSRVPPEAARPRVAVEGPEAGTVIAEYQLPESSNGWRREVVAPWRTDFIWGVDMYQNRLFRLDPATGALKWEDVPGDKQGPHTINRDAAGNVWIALEEGEALARFEPAGARWKIYRYGHLSEAQMLAHDIAFGPDHNVIMDVNGYLWLTIITTNQLVSINPETGDMRLHNLPLPEGRTAPQALLYGAAMSPDRRKVYWTQLRGNVGMTDVQTGESSFLLELDRYSGARRMAVDEHERLWVPLTGAGEIVCFDTRTDKEIARYALPYRSAGTYSVVWDRQRQRLWAATIATDSLLALEPATGKWFEYPLPTKEAIFRVLSVAEDGRVWGSYSARGKIRNSRVLRRDEIVIALMPGDGENSELHAPMAQTAGK